FHVAEQAGGGGGEPGVERALEGEDHVARRDPGAVVPAGAAVQLEDQRQRITPGPAPRELGNEPIVPGEWAADRRNGQPEEELVGQIIIGGGRRAYGRHRGCGLLTGDDDEGTGLRGR